MQPWGEACGSVACFHETFSWITVQSLLGFVEVQAQLGRDQAVPHSTGAATRIMKTAVSIDSAISLLGIQPKEILQKEKAICIKMITVALLKIASNREPPSSSAIWVVNYRTSTNTYYAHTKISI